MTEGESPTNVPQPGDVLAGKYEIEGLLGAGGMGVVLKARHLQLGQQVALKFLQPDVSGRQPEAAERFLREARASIQLRSEHVARVIDVGSHEGLAYTVMEYLEGTDLGQLLRRRPTLDSASVVEYLLQAAEALAEAHQLGIVHRDLKPANLFLTARVDGSPLIKVLDFGISKAVVPGERGITRTDAVMGSPGYMSPEQIRSAKHVDHRADIWGMGVIAYELLTGVPPFDGDNIATLSAQIVVETPKRVDALRPEIPKALGDVVARCLEKEPAKRFQNMAELAEALRPFAPPSAAAMVDRVRRIARASSPFAETVSAESAPARVVSTSAGTVDNWEQSKQQGRPRRALWLAGIAGAALILAVVFVAGRESADLAEPAQKPPAGPAGKALQPERSKTAAAPEAASIAVPEAAPSATPQAASNAAPQAPPASASAAPAATAAKAVKRSRQRAPVEPKAAQCPKGQTLSNGHCCPAGMVWQNDRCDRPLATVLP